MLAADERTDHQFNARHHVVRSQQKLALAARRKIIHANGPPIMKDRILDAHLIDFRTQFGLGSDTEAEAFEVFANHCVVSQSYSDAFDPCELSVGGGGDLGLDGIATLVNEHLAFSPSDVDYLKGAHRRLDAHFIFVQAKTSPHFDVAEIGSFLSGVRTFFNEHLPSGTNDDVQGMHALKEHIFAASVDMERSPRCSLYYVTTGQWNNDAALLARIDQGTDDLKRTGLFSSVDFVPVDAEYLKRVHRELHHGINRDILFEKHVIVPQIGGVQESYIGIVPATEYLRLICDDNGVLNRRLFYDNVRDFQGLNSVNQEIAETLDDQSQSDRFALLNNGITIVARGATKIGARFNLKNYQIVNGCQTSHMLHMQRAKLNDSVFVPLKLIVTEDVDVTTQIIQGTNRQTEVKLEAFESVLPFQKKLEEFYRAASRDLPQPLYYERRSKQYDGQDVRKDRILSLAAQVKCFVAMFLNEPHSTHRYYGELLSSYRGRLFGESHHPFSYFLSGVAFASLEQCFADGTLARSLRPLKYHILTVFRLQNETSDLPRLNSKEIEKYSTALLERLRDTASTREVFRSASSLALDVYQRTPRGMEAPERTRALTSAIVERTKSGAVAASVEQTLGIVKWFSETLGYGFIIGPNDNEYFFHRSNLAITSATTPTHGEGVTFSIAEGRNGPQASGVLRM